VAFLVTSISAFAQTEDTFTVKKMKGDVKKNEWEMVELGEMFSLEYGKSLRKKERKEGLYPVMGSNGRTGFHNQFLVKGAVIIIGRKGSAGEVVWENNDCFPIDTTYYIKIKDSKRINLKYLYHVLKFIDLTQFKGGAGIPGLNRNDVYKIEIPLPPPEIQKQMVSELENYQRIIDGARQVVKNWKPNIKIDPEWEMVELGKICDPEYGFTDTAKEKGEFRFIRITDISSNGQLLSQNKKYIESSKEAQKYFLKKGDLLVARTGATFGKTLLFNSDEPSIFASFLIRLNFPKEKLLPEFYWYFSQSENYWLQANQLVTGGGQPQFNGSAIKQIKFPLPPIKIQKEIVAEIEAEQKVVEANRGLIERFEKKIKGRIEELWGE